MQLPQAAQLKGQQIGRQDDFKSKLLLESSTEINKCNFFEV